MISIIDRIFIDFDCVYKERQPEPGTIVLSSNYHNEWVINVNKEPYSQDVILHHFDAFLSGVEQNTIHGFSIADDKVYLYKNFFLQLGTWFEALKSLMQEGKINSDTTIIFSSYCDNSNISLFEAEGESNRQFLYKSSFYLSYYINKYLIDKGVKNIIIKRKQTNLATLSFYARGLIVLSVKFLQLLYYKVFTFKRDYLQNSNHSKSPILAVSSRGIVQTQFIEGLYSYIPSHLFVIINEASSRPYANLRAAKETFSSFFYSEGYLDFKDLFRAVCTVVRAYSKRSREYSNFYEVKISLGDILPELSIFRFHMVTYALSVEKAIRRFRKNKRLSIDKFVSFEMLSPFALHVKRLLKNIPVIQIQTTLVLAKKHPNFVYSDKFYFTSKEAYNDHVVVNKHFADQLSVMPNLKYIGIKVAKEKRVDEINTLTYFTQPIYLDEEIKLIDFLKEFCRFNGLSFYIKFHPRADQSKYVTDNIGLLPAHQSSQKVISTSDIVVTRNSSIGLDCWYQNVPVLFFVNGTLTKEGISYIPSDYKGTITSQVSIEELSKFLGIIVDDFYAHPYRRGLRINSDKLITTLFENN